MWQGSLKQHLRVSHVGHELLFFPDDISSLPNFSGVRVARSLVFCAMLFFLYYSIVLSVFRFTVFGYPFGIQHFSQIM
jgi:hypothetical protein